MSNPVVGNPVNFPQRTQPLSDTPGPTGETITISTAWFLLLQAFFDRTGGGSGEVTLTAQSAVADVALVAQATATQLRLQLSSVVGANGAVALPAYTAGKFAVVFNVGAAQTTVFPAPLQGAQINALGVNNGFVLPAGKMQVFFFETNVQIRTMSLA